MLWWFAQTTLIAGGLAVVATLAGRWKRLGPEARHVLWLVVLLKFVTPPIVAWPWGVPNAWPARVDPSPAVPAVVVAVPTPMPPPPIEPPPAALPDPEASIEPLPELAPPGSPIPIISDLKSEMPDLKSEIPDRQSARAMPELREPIAGPQQPKPAIWSPTAALLSLWLAGSIAVVVRRGIRINRFRRTLTGARPAPGWLVETTRAIGERVGVRPPPVLAISGVGTPLLWCLGRPRLILPDALIERLDPDRWPGILAHELAHLARRDHWVVRLELLAEAVWWWNPLFRLARRRLHEEAERACDARVIRSLPERRFAYAEALVDVCEHLARSAIPSPALGVGGAGASRSLEGRLLMILRDPIPRRPSRRAALAALILSALALPAWTLGQQPDAASPKSDAQAKPGAPSKPEAPPEAPAKPEAPPEASKPSPAETPRPSGPPARDLTIEAIKAGFASRLKTLECLGFRYSNARRDRPARMLGGHSQAVGVQVADVLLNPGSGSNFRLDVLSALVNPDLPNPGGVLNPGEPPARWSRQFVAKDGSGIVTFQSSWSQVVPVPFRRQPVRGLIGDDLAVALLNPNYTAAVNRDRSDDDPLEPPPANVLDLAGATVLLLGPGNDMPGQLDVAGVDVVEGREVVGVAWVGNRNDGNGGGGLRGLLWVAPSLGFAVVRSEATQDPSQVNMGHGRRTWRKTAGDFVEVGGLWLPRKVEIRSTVARFGINSPRVEHELVAAFEDYRANPEVTPETFHPKFKVEALDERTGHFTTLPPKPSPGLVDRLAKAVRESKFGPPAVEETAEEPKVVDPTQAAKPLSPGIPAPDARALKPGSSRPDAAKPAPAIDADPAPRPADPRPAAEPGKGDPAPAIAKAEQDRLIGLIERRFQADSEVAEVVTQMTAAKKRVDDAERVAADRSDPALREARRNLNALRERYEQLWEVKTGEAFRKPLPAPVRPGSDEFELLAIRRAGKLAEVQKVEARRDLAKADAARASVLLARNAIDRPSFDQATFGLKVAEAELDRVKSELNEAVLLLNRARRDPGSPAIAPSASTPADLRDAVELMEVQLQGKQAELGGAEAKADLERRQLERIKGLDARGAVEPKLVDEASARFDVAAAGVKSKKAEVAELELRLKQAKRRAGSIDAAQPDRRADGPAIPSTLADLRDAVELMEAQIQGKQAELRGAVVKRKSAKAVVDAREPLATDGRITPLIMMESQTALQTAEAEVEQKMAEVLEFEVRLKHARRRVEAEEARLKREAGRAKAELDRIETLAKQGAVAIGSLEAARARYDELMLQLDPKYAPAPINPPADPTRP